MCTIEVEATIVNTTAYDVLLGMEFVAAMCGAYDSYTEMFTYRWHDATGLLNSYSISAPCHVSSRCYDERREGIIALGQAYTLGHITGMKEGRMVI